MSKKSHSFAHSVAWNLAGAGIPLAFAFLSVPRLLTGYGAERFGFLAIIWALIGYFSIFDFGIGRALTKLVSDRLGGGRSEEIPDLVRTALISMFVLSIIACLVLILVAPILLGLLQLGPDLYQECLLSLRILALGIPFVIASSGLIGLLEARAQFHSVNQIRLLMGMLSFIAPLLALAWSTSLVPATAALAVSRAITTGLYFTAASHSGSGSTWSGRFHRAHLQELLSFGSWTTVSNLASPMMAQLDKLIVASIVAVQLLPFYAIPGDLINRLSFIPAAIIGVFFPAFSAHWSAGRIGAVLRLYGDAGSAMFAAVFPLAICVYAFAPEALALWMGEEFSQRSASLIRWLCVGLLANAFARIPHALLQAIGRPSITAKLHLLELPIYGVALWLLLEQFGILGAAIAWSGRMILDLLLLGVCARIAVPDLKHKAVAMLAATLTVSALMYATSLIESPWTKFTVCGLAGVIGVTHTLTILMRNRHDE